MKPAPQPNNPNEPPTLFDSPDTTSTKKLGPHRSANHPPGKDERIHERFAQETAQLIHQRLTIYTLIGILGLIVATIFSPLLIFMGLRLVALAVMIGLLLLLRGHQHASLNQMRWLELFCVLTPFSLVISIANMKLLRLANEGHIVNFTVELQYEMGLVAIIICVYGFLIPNPWKRALVVLSILTLSPYIVTAALYFQNDRFFHSIQHISRQAPIPLPFAALAASVISSHLVDKLRRENFRVRSYGQYRLVELLGEGGMGKVFRAEHLFLKRPCAIKLIQPTIEGREEILQQFEQEVQTTAQLSHWNTVEIYDYGRTEEGDFYYAMELLPGRNLFQLVQQMGVISAGRAIYLLCQLCDALAEAHEQDFIHRDIKPGNIFVSKRGGHFDVVKVIDFGLVIDRRHGEKTQSARSLVSGSPPYMAPEQAMAQPELGPGCDIYAIGCVTYFMLTGKPPFIATDPNELLNAQVNKIPPDLSTRTPTPISSKLNAVVAQCLEKEPTARHQSVRDLQNALQSCPESSQWSDLLARQWWNQHAEAMSQIKVTDSTNLASKTRTLLEPVRAFPRRR